MSKQKVLWHLLGAIVSTLVSGFVEAMLTGSVKAKSCKQPDPELQSAAEAKRLRKMERNRRIKS